MKSYYYTTTTGAQFVARLSYEKDAQERGYYSTIQPVTVTAESGLYCFSFEPYAAIASGSFECVLLKPVKCASYKALDEATDRFNHEICSYFERRGLVARRATVEELARENGGR